MRTQHASFVRGQEQEQEEESGVVVHDALEVLVLTHCWSLGQCGFTPKYIPHARSLSLPRR